MLLSLSLLVLLSFSFSLSLSQSLMFASLGPPQCASFYFATSLPQLLFMGRVRVTKVEEAVQAVFASHPLLAFHSPQEFLRSPRAHCRAFRFTQPEFSLSLSLSPSLSLSLSFSLSPHLLLGLSSCLFAPGSFFKLASSLSCLN